MKVGQIGPTFIFPVKTVTFYWVESLVISSILKMRKSPKKLAPIYAYSHAYTQLRDRGGWLGPPTLNRVKPIHCSTNTSFWISNKCAASQRCYHMIVDPHVAAARFQVKAQIDFPTWYIQVPFSCILPLLCSHYAIRYLTMIIPLVAPVQNLALSWRLDSKCNCPLLALKS